MNKTNRYLFIISFTLLLFASKALYAQSYNTSFKNASFKNDTDITSEKNVKTDIRKLAQVLYYMNQYYLDTVNFTSISDEAVDAMMKKLDPHSSFISAKDVKAMNEPLAGNFDGIGIEFAIIKDTLCVQNVFQGGPSEKVGLKTGDKITSVDGKQISGKELDIPKVHKYLRGQKGTKVTLGILRRNEDSLMKFTVTRDKIPLNSIDAHYIIDSNILYVKLSRFAATSYKELMDIVSGLEKRPSGIILDLRGNGGGYLLAALQIVNEFLDKGNMILYTEGMRVSRQAEYANGRGTLKDIKTVILIDENSTSASEIVAGAIQDWDRGTIIGRKSFGKGLVQQQLPLEDGSVIRLTIARYHTPSGRVIQSPYEMGNSEKYYKNFIERYNKGEFFSKDNIHLPDSLKYYTLKLKRPVYGGGGIMPDIFIPADTSYYSQYYSKLIREGVAIDFVNQYVDNNRNTIKQEFNTYDSFVLNFSVSDKMIKNLIEFASEAGVKYNETEFKKSKKDICNYIKALVIRSIYGFNNFIMFLNTKEEDMIKAIDILNKDNV